MKFLLILILFTNQSLLASEVDSEMVEDAPVQEQELEGDINLTASRSWRAPVFTDQEGALGWSAETFQVPSGYEDNVNFWKRIYTEFTTDQGVIHDSEELQIVFGELNFSSISMQAKVGMWRKEALKKQLVDSEKKRIRIWLNKINEKVKTGELLSEHEKKVVDLYGGSLPKDLLSGERLRFQLGQKDRIIQGIFFSGRYLEEFEKIFREEGLPIELTRMPFVESSFNIMARSRVGASGLWQIMPNTGRSKLMMNDVVDKRNYPLEAARMAARYLRGNYKMLESWPLAIIGYNHGPSGVGRIAKVRGSKDVVELGRKDGNKKRLGFASRNFYASFLAVLEAEKNAPKYFGSVRWSQRLPQYEVVLGLRFPSAQLLELFDGDRKTMQIFNPHLSSVALKGAAMIPKETRIMIPEKKQEQFNRMIANLEKSAPKKKNTKKSKR